MVPSHSAQHVMFIFIWESVELDDLRFGRLLTPPLAICYPSRSFTDMTQQTNPYTICSPLSMGLKHFVLETNRLTGTVNIGVGGNWLWKVTLFDKEIVGLGRESLDLLQHYYRKRIRSRVCHLFPLPQRADTHAYGKHTLMDTRLAQSLGLKGSHECAC